MSTYAAYLQAHSLTSAQAASATTAIQTRLDSRPKVRATVHTQAEGATFALYAQGHYTTAARRDAVRDALVTWLDANAPEGSTGTLTAHLCRHDTHETCSNNVLVWSK